MITDKIRQHIHNTLHEHDPLNTNTHPASSGSEDKFVELIEGRSRSFREGSAVVSSARPLVELLDLTPLLEVSGNNPS